MKIALAIIVCSAFYQDCLPPQQISGTYNTLFVCEQQCTLYECVPTSIPTPGLPTQQQCVTHVGPLSLPYHYYNLPPNYYPGLALCQAGCQDIPVIPIDTWDCVFDPGQVQQLPSYNCIQNYIGPLPVLGQYTSLLACQDNCGDRRQPPKESYDCDDSYNCYDPGTGLGQYPTLAACQAICKPISSPQPMPTPEEPEDTGY